MERGSRKAVPEQDILGIYARIDFSSETSEPNWNRVGNAIQLDDGSLELKFLVWPTNVKTFRILREDEAKDLIGYRQPADAEYLDLGRVRIR